MTSFCTCCQNSHGMGGKAWKIPNFKGIRVACGASAAEPVEKRGGQRGFLPFYSGCGSFQQDQLAFVLPKVGQV